MTRRAAAAIAAVWVLAACGSDDGDDGGAAGGRPRFVRPKGNHVMLVDLAAPLAAGATFDAILHFATAPDQVVTVTVSDDAP